MTFTQSPIPETIREPNVEEKLVEALSYLFEAGNILDEMLRQGQSPQPETPSAGITVLSTIISRRSASLVGALSTLRNRLGTV